jgi:hypothetical protein
MPKNDHSVRAHFLILLVLTVFGPQPSVRAQQQHYDLSTLVQHRSFQVENRSISSLPAENALRFSAADGDGVAWLEGVEFSNGTIELDIRGKDVIQQSFVGVAFHGISKDSLEAVYFRPFNFQSPDTLRHSHMVQYVSHPEYPWNRLRSEQPAVFEKPIGQAPKPADWFHARIVVHYPQVKVYVNHQSSPCLEVTELSKRKMGRIGLWVGNNSDGDFANLIISDQQ